jgi:hypothetical protein
MYAVAAYSVQSKQMYTVNCILYKVKTDTFCYCILYTIRANAYCSAFCFSLFIKQYKVFAL